MSFSDVDRNLLQRCLQDDPAAWGEFVDRFVGLIIHTAEHTAARGREDHSGRALDASTRDDLVSEVFVVLLRNDKSVLRRFRRQSSLATYLCVIARRVIARRLMQQRLNAEQSGVSDAGSTDSAIARIDNAEHVERLLNHLPPQQSQVVRMYHLQGKTYREIADALGLAENSIGPMLSRARERLQGEG